MLYVLGGPRMCQWHIGEKFPIAAIDIYSIQEIQADCDELELIRAELTNIPMSNRRVVNWYGDNAKFIAAFLINYSHS